MIIKNKINKKKFFLKKMIIKNIISFVSLNLDRWGNLSTNFTWKINIYSKFFTLLKSIFDAIYIWNNYKYNYHHSWVGEYEKRSPQSINVCVLCICILISTNVDRMHTIMASYFCNLLDLFWILRSVVLILIKVLEEIKIFSYLNIIFQIL